MSQTASRWLMLGTVTFLSMTSQKPQGGRVLVRRLVVQAFHRRLSLLMTSRQFRVLSFSLVLALVVLQVVDMSDVAISCRLKEFVN